jgi:hypothetical protein
MKYLCPRTGMCVFSCLFLFSVGLSGQITPHNINGSFYNSLQTSVPFLTLAPDPRATGMGDAGVATSPDVNSQHWNSAKYPFIADKAGFALTHTPWLRKVISNVDLLYLAGFYRLDERSAVSSSIRYFSLGEIFSGVFANSYHPFEIAFDAGYSLKFTENFSGGFVLRYIHSDLSGGQQTFNGQEVRPGRSFAGDLGFYYQNSFDLAGMDAQWSWGLNVSNIGTPVSYVEEVEKTPIPTNVRAGAAFLLNFNENHSLALTADLNKLMVPTPPVYGTDTATGDHYILHGMEAQSIVGGMFQSFYDAPGWEQEDGSRSVFREELAEIQFSSGAEYRYRNEFAFRTGYFHEHAYKGNRKYFTIGAGVFNEHFSMEVSYLFPVGGGSSPLAETFRISLAVIFGSGKYQKAAA